MQTLLLSPEYEPLQPITWQRAMVLLVRDRVEVLTSYADKVIHSARETFQVPAVVRLKNWIKGRRRGVRFSKENVFTRDKGRCQYCHVQLKRDEATYDHVTPRFLGGMTRWENIVIACVPCNQKKSNLTLAQAGMELRIEPVRPKHLPETLRISYARAEVPEPWRDWIRKAVFEDGEI